MNLADNKDCEDPVKDYLLGITRCGPYSDFMVLNISCPNQVGTTALQEETRLRGMLDQVGKEDGGHVQIYQYLNLLPEHAPLLLKLSPDLTHEQRDILWREQAIP